MSKFEAYLKQLLADGRISQKIFDNQKEFFTSYKQAVEANHQPFNEDQLITLLELAAQEAASPFKFDLYHKKITSPFNYYKYGLDFLRPLIDFKASKLVGKDTLNQIEAQLKAGENVILFANHQTEPDPQAISLMLENEFPYLAEEMIFVAGHRVTTDPLAIPFSKGRNLLCIYSKKHIENPPELKEEKQLHNQKTMKRMTQLLAEGGQCIYVAPSGGRDRANEHGQVEVAPFDPASLELFYLMAKKSGKKTHFYPLALSTYHLFPPPKAVEKALGERRIAQAGPIYLHFLPEFDMDTFEGADPSNKKNTRAARAHAIWTLVNSALK